MAVLLTETTYRTAPIAFVIPARAITTPPKSLVEAVQHVVRQIPEGNLHSSAPSSGHAPACPYLLLSLLTYCLARQIYGTMELLNYLASSEAFCQVCGDQLPGAAELQEFRQANRAELEKCLTAALLFLARQKVAAGVVTRANETVVADEAKRRVLMSACVDRMEMAAWQPGVRPVW